MPPCCAAAVLAARRAHAGAGPSEEKEPLKLPVEPAFADEIFKGIDTNKNSQISLEELRAALIHKGCTETMVLQLFQALDKDGNDHVDHNELRWGLEQFGTAREPPSSLVGRTAGAMLDFINHWFVQTLLYFVFVIVFQILLNTIREPNEYFLDKFIADTFIENHFDSSHNTLESIRRVPDIWEWGNNVLWPGLLGNLGPCGAEVGAVSAMAGGVGLSALAAAKQCTDNVWPDGEGSFQLRDPTGYTVAELAHTMNNVDWTQGLSIRQVRVRSTSSWPAGGLGDECFAVVDDTNADTESFGYNWTTGGATPLSQPWKYWDAEQLGADPSGQTAASVASGFRSYPSAGFVAVVLPFFSDTLLPEEAGTAEEVTDFRLSRATFENDREPKYFCVRLSWNGEYVQQVCDPNDAPGPEGRITGVVRAAVEAFWNDMKRGHFIDYQTRFLHFTLQLRSNNVGIGSRASFMFELTPAGGVLPSYDTETSVNTQSVLDSTEVYMNIALAMVIFFILLEGVELYDSGPGEYFSDVWNLMDWINFVILIILYAQLVDMLQSTKPEDHVERCAGSLLCTNVGFFDEWYRMRVTKSAKLYISLNVSIQLLKIIKFINVMIPKTELAVAVLKMAAVDMIFFSLVFLVTLFAFSNMFFVLLGPVMEGFSSQISSMIFLGRALFGDFDANVILNNSNSWLNLIFFLVYLFIAIFIMLSIFLTILGESQGATSAVVDTKKNDPNEEYKEFGIIEEAAEFVSGYRQKLFERFGSTSSVATEAMKHLQIDAPQYRDSDIPNMVADLFAKQKEMIARVQTSIDNAGRPTSSRVLSDDKNATELGLEDLSGSSLPASPPIVPAAGTTSSTRDCDGTKAMGNDL